MRCGNDVCGDDVDLVGEVLDLSLDQLLATYAHTTTEGEYLRSLYPDADTDHEWNAQAPTATPARLRPAQSRPGGPLPGDRDMAQGGELVPLLPRPA